jgi:hypothetical protein
MATIIINEFVVEIPGADQLRFKISFTLNRTVTEVRFNIPFHVWLRLMQRKGAKIETIHLFADESTSIDEDIGDELFTYASSSGNPKGGDPIGRTYRDIPIGVWEYVGLYDSSEPKMFSFSRNLTDLPSDSDNENWYVVIVVRPDIQSSIAYSNVIPVNI